MDTSSTKPAPKNYNKAAYVVFVIAAIGFACVKNFSEAFTFWGLALIFDPFDTKMRFNDRPRYQRWWLIVHVSIALIALGLMGLFYKR